MAGPSEPLSAPQEPLSAPRPPRARIRGRARWRPLRTTPNPPGAGVQPTRPRRTRGASALAIAAGALALWLVTGVGFANYDTLYALVWGEQLARGATPQYGIPIAPTPHPLVEALGFVLSPLGARTLEDVTVVLAFLALAGCGWAVYRLGALWFNRGAGAVAAVLLLTRVPILSYGVRAYIDVPYLLLILSALIVETRRPRAGAPVLALLALAGLLRPEAWVFSGLYWLYLALAGRVSFARAGGAPEPTGRARAPGSVAEHGLAGDDEDLERGFAVRSPRELAWLASILLSAPALWVLSDWRITGDALWSLTNTRHTALTLGRETGIAKVPEYVPRRIGEILGPAALAGAAVGGVLALAWLRRRALLGAWAGVVAVLVLAAFASVGLPIDTRYAFVPAALLCVFCGGALCGWTLLDHGDRRRRAWAALAALVALALLATAPAQYRVDHNELRALAVQQRIQDDLVALVRSGAITTRCEPVGVPNHAPIPLLALYLRTDPSAIPSAQALSAPLAHGTYVDPATAEVQREYILDRAERAHPVSVPGGFALRAVNRSWRIYQRCG
jgi:hypothetical protein